MTSISSIKEEFVRSSRDAWPLLISQYTADTRVGVQNIIKKYHKEIEKYEAEKKRSYEMASYEREYSHLNYICGIDEVGRGPLAGPVVAGAVILPKDCDILYLDDSKKLSEKKREELYHIIMKNAVAVGIGIVSPFEIDQIGINPAVFKAMREAVGKLGIIPDVYLNDAVTIPELEGLQVPIIKGDAKSISIAAASIVAKVTRDKMMVEYDEVLEGYDLASNKGYGSAKHILAIKELGPTPIHRMCFLKNLI